MRLLWLFEFCPVPRLHWAAFQRPVVFGFIALSLLGWNRHGYWIYRDGYGRARWRKKNASVFFGFCLASFSEYGPARWRMIYHLGKG